MEVKCNVVKADPREFLADGFGELTSQRTLEFRRCDFDAREAVVIAYAKLLETPLA